MSQKKYSKSGETFAEVLVAVIVAMLAMIMLRTSCSAIFSSAEAYEPKAVDSRIHIVFTLGDSSYETEMDVAPCDGGYKYVGD